MIAEPDYLHPDNRAKQVGDALRWVSEQTGPVAAERFDRIADALWNAMDEGLDNRQWWRLVAQLGEVPKRERAW